jgi:hypothetical protein
MVTLAAVGNAGRSRGRTFARSESGYPRRRSAASRRSRRVCRSNSAYPYPDVKNILVKLGAKAGGGVGGRAMSSPSTSSARTWAGRWTAPTRTQHQALGPCPLHLTTFDLTRHGMVISGHATESLPQIVLEMQGDDIYAVGVQGLVYGYSAMTTASALEENDMSKNERYIAADRVPLPPKDADVLHHRLRLLHGRLRLQGLSLARRQGWRSGRLQNALKSDFPHQNMMGAWISPAQHNVVSHKGKPHNVVIVPDKDAKVVNVGGNHSMRGGTLGAEVLQPEHRDARAPAAADDPRQRQAHCR